MDKLNSKEAGPASFDGNDIPEDDRELFCCSVRSNACPLKENQQGAVQPKQK